MHLGGGGRGELEQKYSEFREWGKKCNTPIKGTLKEDKPPKDTKVLMYSGTPHEGHL